MKGVALSVVLLTVAIAGCSNLSVSQPHASVSPSPSPSASPEFLGPPLPSPSPEAVESGLTPQQQQKVNDVFKVATILEKQGREMEKLRTSQNDRDSKRCRELMLKRQAIVKDLEKQLEDLPNDDYGVNTLRASFANLTFCVSCGDSAVSDCNAVNKDLAEVRSTLKQ